MKTFDDPASVNYTDFSLVEVREAQARHQGLFARTRIPRGTLIGCFAGRIVVLETDPAKGGYKRTSLQHRQVLQLRQLGEYMLGLVAIGGFKGVDFINHSCRANASVQDRVVVLASRDIEADEEITLDYRAWDFMPEGIRCWCPDPQCII